MGKQQWLEILKALYRNARLLVLDEPTSVLTPDEGEQLFRAIRKLTQEGRSVIFISHKLSEVLEITDRITVIRDVAWWAPCSPRRQRSSNWRE